MAQSKEEIDAGINEYENEHCAHLDQIGQLAREAGVNVPGETELPELNADGSLANPEDEEPTDD